MKFLNGLLGRAPFAFLGAMGIFSIVGNFMTLEENIYQTLEAWRAVTRPIWDFLLGWMFDWIEWEHKWLLKDYLTLAAVTFGATVRTFISLGPVHTTSQQDQEDALILILPIIFFVAAWMPLQRMQMVMLPSTPALPVSGAVKVAS